MKEAEQFKQEYRPTIDRILPLIQQSTELALDFNDQYSSEEMCEKNLENLARDLNQLGEKMVERFDLEDRLINDLHSCHRDMVA
jgi:regulator of sigma D